MTLRKTLKNLREQNRKFYLVLWEGEDTVSIVRDTDIVDPSLDRVAIDSTVSVKVHRKMYIGKVAAIGSREELTSIEKTYTEKRLNSIPEESTEELEELEQPCELVKRETNLKRDLEEPMESGSPFKRSRKEDKGFSAPVRRKTTTAANGRRPSSSAKLTKIAHLEDHIYDVPITSSTPKPDSLVSRPPQTTTAATASPLFSPVVQAICTNGLTTPVTPTTTVTSSVSPPLPPKPVIPGQNGMGIHPQNVSVSHSNVNHKHHPYGLTQSQVRNHCLSCPPNPMEDWYKVGSGSPQSTGGIHGGSSGGDPSPAKMISDSDPLLLEITIMGIDSRVHKLEEQLSRIERNQNLIVQRLSNVETFCSQLYQFTQGPHNYPPPNPFYCTRL